MQNKGKITTKNHFLETKIINFNIFFLDRSIHKTCTNVHKDMTLLKTHPFYYTQIILQYYTGNKNI